MSSSMTQYQLIFRRQAKKEEQREKTRARMARYRLKLKELPMEEQKAATERARLARARYRESHRLELRTSAKCLRAHHYAAKYGDDAYKAKVQQKFERMEEKDRKRRTVRPRVPKGQGKKSRRARCPDDSGDNGTCSS
ncbi:hypothetical protein FB451DRAFT_1564459 [Mycena latifolia]|nr:hypothetical protein FB451DRAFT_1564459 [Mycena latifolia]